MQTIKALASLSALALGVTLLAQAPGGGYTVDQAQVGQQLYTKSCATCHGPTLNGSGNAPPLAGTGFLANWRDRSSRELFATIKESMPPDAAGILPDTSNAAIVAFILQTNGIPPGGQPLTASTVIPLASAPAQAAQGGAPAGRGADAGGRGAAPGGTWRGSGWTWRGARWPRRGARGAARRHGAW